VIKTLNLYAGIGGNRKYWKDVDVTAVEIMPEIAKIYQDFFPEDKMIITDAHQYLLEHFNEFDFIWSSPPCPTHSKVNQCATYRKGTNILIKNPKYPNMKLYEEILFLQGYSKGKWVVENIISWYSPLINPQEVNKHYFWSNFLITKFKREDRAHKEQVEGLQKRKDFNLNKYNIVNKRQILRNCVEPETGLHIFNCAFNTFHSIPGYYKQESLIK